MTKNSESIWASVLGPPEPRQTAGIPGIQGHVAVGGAALLKLGLIAKVFDDGVQRLYDGGVGVLGSGGNVAVLFVIPGDGVFAPSGGLLVGGLLEGVHNAGVQFLQFLSGVGAEVEFDGGTGHDGMDAGVAARVEVGHAEGGSRVLRDLETAILATALAAACSGLATLPKAP